MVVATGFFDGVHTGHRLVISQLVEAARARGTESMIVTFWPHPRNVLQKEARGLRLLSSLQEKISMLKSLGVDRVEVIEFTKDFSSLTMRQYLKDWLVGKFGATALLVGYDNRIGSDCSSSQEVVDAALELGLEVIRPGVLSAPKGYAVSSTKIRSCLERGDVVEAGRMLGYLYRLTGVVVEGNRIGRTIGFPTANMQLYDPLKIIPENGVYFVKVHTLGEDYYGMCNIGNRPTVGQGNARTIETNIFFFDEDIYGLDIEISFIERIREEQKFNSLAELSEQLKKDRYICKSLIK